MINAMNNFGHNQFEFARWAKEERERYKIIKVGIVSERERRFSSVIQNLITADDTTVLYTTFPYPYAVGQQLFYRNKWWAITSLGQKTLDVSPQAMALVNVETASMFYLELQEADR